MYSDEENDDFLIPCSVSDVDDNESKTNVKNTNVKNINAKNTNAKNTISSKIARRP